jgi:hypothetical protein
VGSSGLRTLKTTVQAGMGQAGTKSTNARGGNADSCAARVPFGEHHLDSF